MSLVLPLSPPASFFPVRLQHLSQGGKEGRGRGREIPPPLSTSFIGVLGKRGEKKLFRPLSHWGSVPLSFFHSFLCRLLSEEKKREKGGILSSRYFLYCNQFLIPLVPFMEKEKGKENGGKGKGGRKDLVKPRL